jgi:hypothetical protein
VEKISLVFAKTIRSCVVAVRANATDQPSCRSLPKSVPNRSVRSAIPVVQSDSLWPQEKRIQNGENMKTKTSGLGAAPPTNRAYIAFSSGSETMKTVVNSAPGVAQRFYRLIEQQQIIP